MKALKLLRDEARPMSLPVYAGLTLFASAAVTALILYALA